MNKVIGSVSLIFTDFSLLQNDNFLCLGSITFEKLNVFITNMLPSKCSVLYSA